ncbi:MAG TPA: lysylphosphatidylglycerol synthase domain-containing protein [Acidobacteriota bacterium]|jgi:hypothetical protein
MIRFFSLLLGLALLAYLILHLGPGQILIMLVSVGWTFLPVVLIYIGHQLVRAAALRQCILTGSLSFVDVFSIRLSGETVQYLTFTGPFLAEPTKAWLLRKRGLQTGEAFAAVIAEFLIYAFVSAVLALVGLAFLLRHFQTSRTVSNAVIIIIGAMVAFLIVSAIAILLRFYLIGTIIERISLLPLIRSRLQVDMGAVHRMEDLLLAVLRERPFRLAGIAAIEMLAQALLILEVYVILRALNFYFPFLYPFLIESTTKFASAAFFFIPGQVGATEGTYSVVFKILELSPAAGVALSLIRRMRSVLVAAVGLFVLSRTTS